MKKLLVEYFNIIGYTITGIIFGFSFFLLFMNFYHYKDVNDIYVKQDNEVKMREDIYFKLSSIKGNIKDFDPNKYTGSSNVYVLSSIKSKIDTCVKKIDTEDLSLIMNKNNISTKDIYDMQQFYQINIIHPTNHHWRMRCQKHIFKKLIRKHLFRNGHLHRSM